jgi:putative DNA primase/helicase
VGIPGGRLSSNRLGITSILDRTPAATIPFPSSNGQADLTPNERKILHKGVKESVDDPHRLARQTLKTRYSIEERKTMVSHRGQAWAFNGSCYRAVEEDELQATLSAVVKAEFDKHNKLDIKEWAENGRKNRAGKRCPMPEVRHVKKSLLGDVKQALTEMTIIPRSIEPPDWLTSDPPFPSHELIPCRNGLLHIPSYLAKNPALYPTTADYFGTYALDFDFDPDAGDPVEWIKFLGTIFKHDPQLVLMLQEWFGYCLTPDTSRQKIGLFVGPTRCGKGTISRVLMALIGRENVATPSMTALGYEFGLQGMVGKPLIVIGDARVSSKQDVQLTVERMLSISGKDTVQIERKFLPAWTGRLPGRLMLLSNETPALPDASCALPGRMLAFHMTESWLGKEDAGLEDRLHKELPCILLWAIKGWERLQKQRKFTEPTKTDAQSIAQEMAALGSPISLFINEKCTIGPKEDVAADDLFQAWKFWCEETNRKAGDSSKFGQKLRAFNANIVKTRPREAGRQVYRYSWISLNVDIRPAPPSPSVPVQDSQSGKDDRPY